MRSLPVRLWFLRCGADVVYDPDVVGHLVKLLSNILRCSSPVVIVCSAIRNQETYSGFKEQLGNTNTMTRLKIYSNKTAGCDSFISLPYFFPLDVTHLDIFASLLVLQATNNNNNKNIYIYKNSRK